LSFTLKFQRYGLINRLFVFFPISSKSTYICEIGESTFLGFFVGSDWALKNHIKNVSSCKCLADCINMIIRRLTVIHLLWRISISAWSLQTNVFLGTLWTDLIKISVRITSETGKFPLDRARNVFQTQVKIIMGKMYVVGLYLSSVLQGVGAWKFIYECRKTHLTISIDKSKQVSESEPECHIQETFPNTLVITVSCMSEIFTIYGIHVSHKKPSTSFSVLVENGVFPYFVWCLDENSDFPCWMTRLEQAHHEQQLGGAQIVRLHVINRCHQEVNQSLIFLTKRGTICPMMQG
jgi:hypothetical protein